MVACQNQAEAPIDKILPINAHASRANVFQKEAFWRLEQDELVREGGEPEKVSPLFPALRVFLRILWPWWSLIGPVEPGGTARFLLVDIAEMQLRFDPTRFDTRRYRCDLRTRDGRKATIWSTHFCSAASFEDGAPAIRGWCGRWRRASRVRTRNAVLLAAPGL